MNAAIYARKSQEQPGVAEQAKSVPGQVADARAFIAKQEHWTIAEAHIYTDDGVSGILFANRAEFQRMMRDAAAGAFEAIVFFDLDRFGRHAHQTMVALHTLADLGVTVWDCSTGVAVDLDSFAGRVSATLQAEFAQQYRDQIRKHTRAALRRKAEMGFCAGGRTFGYENVRIAKGQTERRIKPDEADVVVDIYRRFALGEGARTIAHALNRAGVPQPRAQQGRANGWSQSTVRAVLRRPLYRGELVYGRTTKAYNRELRKVKKYRDTKREKGQIPKPEDTWIRRTVEALRIITPALAAKVDDRLDDRRTRYLANVARADGRFPEKAHGKYLLSGGMLLCSTCGGHFEARKYPFRDPSPPMYMCATRRRKPGVCTNTLALPIAETDDAVLSTIEGEVLGTRFITELLNLVADAPDETVYLAKEQFRLRTENDRLVSSIAAGVPAESVAPLIRKNQTAIGRLDDKLRIPREPRLDHEQLRLALEQRSARWKADLRAEPQVARIVLRRLVGPLTLWDESTRPDFIRWEATPTTELLEGLAVPRPAEASPTGFEPVSWP